jgi:hypothetical protein
MKYVLFILLKVLEVSVVVFVPYLIGKYCRIIFDFDSDKVTDDWCRGFITILILIGIGLGVYSWIFCVIPNWIILNWSLVSKIIGR